MYTTTSVHKLRVRATPQMLLYVTKMLLLCIELRSAALRSDGTYTFDPSTLKKKAPPEGQNRVTLGSKTSPGRKDLT